MKEHTDNPSTNRLLAGVTEEALQKAIEVSGYPLQSIATDIIIAAAGERDRITAQEEWSFLDSELDIVRQLDSLIAVELRSRSDSAFSTDPTAYLRYTAQFLVECKQSDLPYVFFLRSADVGDYPKLAGLPHNNLEMYLIGDEPDRRKIRVDGSIHTILGLGNLPLRKGAPTAIAFAKGHRKGSALELSGDEVFRGISLPLTKAMQHFLHITKPHKRQLYYNVRAVFPVAVLNAPIIGVAMNNGTAEMMAMPWIHVVRSEPEPDDSWDLSSSSRTAFDVVHVDFLQEYTTRALRATRQIAKRIDHIAYSVLTGQGKWRSSAKMGLRTELYEALQPFMTRPEFTDWITKRWQLAHGSKEEEEVHTQPVEERSEPTPSGSNADE